MLCGVRSAATKEEATKEEQEEQQTGYEQNPCAVNWGESEDK